MEFEEQQTIGDCTLIRADCFEVLPKLEENSVDLILTDMPYGISNLKSANSAFDDVVPDLTKLWNHLGRIRKLAAVIALFASGKFTYKLWESNKVDHAYTLTWVKGHNEFTPPYKTGFLNANRRPLSCSEQILCYIPKGTYYQSTYNVQKIPGGTPYTTRGARSARLYSVNRLTSSTSNGERFPAEILYFPIDSSRCNSTKRHEHTYHPSTKPVPLMEWLVRSYSNENEIVLDPFMGSGTTGIACVQAGRKFVGIEVEKKWFDLACQRIEEAYKEYGNERMLISAFESPTLEKNFDKQISLFTDVPPTAGHVSGVELNGTFIGG